jgi:uncharacterized protein YyaL (SSP411 family)
VTDPSPQANANRLAQETSPYLLQHAHNPVDWYPWGEEAFERARKEGRPVFLSIGYSACHWCHVMAHESFEDPDTAEIMNRHFVNIKVDREERPDLDQIYQTAYQLLAGRGGGWPLSMFLDAEGAPFWGGTSFREVLLGVARHYEEKPDDVTHNTSALRQGLAGVNQARPGHLAPAEKLLEGAAGRLLSGFDHTWGGFGGAPKFPSAMALQFLLGRWYRTGNPACLHATLHSLDCMARGGIYDHLGGGFARYSVDAEWRVPHFEKMLYDNAQLIPLYVDAHGATGEERFARVARESLDYVLREMTRPGGGFHAAQDADSEGEEGKYFVWRPGEVEEVAGENAPLFCAYYGVTEAGNFEGQNVLNVHRPLADVAEEFGLDAAEAERRLADARARLLARRSERIAPGRDDKVITAWNGLMLSAFARAWAAFRDPRHREAADTTADFLLAELRTPEGRLLRTWKDGRARYAAYLDDYAFLAEGLLDLGLATGRADRIADAEALMEVVLDHFPAPEGGFYFTADDHESLVARTFTGMDQSVPAGNAVAARCLLRLHHLTGEARYLEAAEGTVRVFLEGATAQPLGHAALLLAAEDLVAPPKVAALVGEADDPEADGWAARLGAAFRPDALALRLTPGGAADLPWLAGKGLVDGQAAAYVCTAGTCAPPVTAWEALEAGLGGPPPATSDPASAPPS